MEKPSLDTAKAGAMRFNTDSSQMEIFDGNQWTGILATSPEQQTGGTRMLVLGGYSTTDRIDAIEISTTGDATDFGDLSFTASQMNNGMSNNSRGVFVVTGSPSAVNNLEFITIASAGNASDFGDAHQAQTRATSGSDSHGGLS